MIKVLIVEDDPMVAEFNKHYLRQIEGFELVASASTADAALQLLEKSAVDLILLDIYMPGINGLQLLDNIRKMGRGVDVIIITAASDIASVKTALRLGAVDYLIKPFEFSRFQAALSTYREEVRVMESREELSQADLDKLLFHHNEHVIPGSIGLPKGLTRNTLQLVWEQIESMRGAEFSTEELAGLVGISRVSMRKYLQFLSEIGVLEVEVLYGAVGRPSYKHHVVPGMRDVLQSYLQG
ncbi:response regulator [Paenibacillus sp. 481]|uniref:response regulator n=1 Tax=Paenibacillus sp. 481 TaxID=2835869 RepID=UPI001E3AC8BB|nr:response regulator [Paenibacillus sp. 481]UHA74836.1 response regulator [Paenibacillus sp. 481]